MTSVRSDGEGRGLCSRLRKIRKLSHVAFQRMSAFTLPFFVTYTTRHHANTLDRPFVIERQVCSAKPQL